VSNKNEFMKDFLEHKRKISDKCPYKKYFTHNSVLEVALLKDMIDYYPPGVITYDSLLEETLGAR